MDDTDVPALLATDLDHHFKYVVSIYQHRLYAFALRQTGSPQEAEDIVQDALIQAYFALRNYPAQRIQTLILQPWLYRIVINVFYSRRRRLHIQFVPFDSSEDSPLLEIEDLSRKPDEELWWQERRRELEMLVATLPERYRVAVNLHYFEELSYQEIADLLDQPTGSVKSMVHRGVALLRQAWKTTYEDRVGYTHGTE